MNPPLRQVRANYDDTSITVYQAYGDAIAQAAITAGRFAPPFKLDRMTWIKPSFLWMMYRSGWASKPGQEHILAIRITREGFESALSPSALSHFDPAVHRSRDVWSRQKEASPVRVQWDPERDLTSAPLPWRSIQIGLGGSTVRDYVESWILRVTDITARVRALQSSPQLISDLPPERPYDLPATVAARIGVTQAGVAPRATDEAPEA